MALKALMILPVGKAKSLQNRFLAFTQPENVLFPRVNFLIYPVRKIFSNGAGFTLIELLLIVAILAVLAGLSIPAFKKTHNRLKLENSALNIVSMTRLARTKAIVESRIYRLNFDIQTKTYWLSCESDEPVEDFERISGRFAKTFQIPADITLDISQTHVSFYPNGNSDNLTIILSNSDGLRREITKSGVFGEFRVKE